MQDKSVDGRCWMADSRYSVKAILDTGWRIKEKANIQMQNFVFFNILHVAFLQQNVVILNDLLWRWMIRGKSMACKGDLFRERIRERNLGAYKK